MWGWMIDHDHGNGGGDEGDEGRTGGNGRGEQTPHGLILDE